MTIEENGQHGITLKHFVSFFFGPVISHCKVVNNEQWETKVADPYELMNVEYDDDDDDDEEDRKEEAGENVEQQ